MGAIISLIWGFIGPTLVSLALNVGLPQAMLWLSSKGLPKWIVDAISELIKKALDQVTGLKQITVTASTDIQTIKKNQELSAEQKKQAIKEVKVFANRAAKEHCTGVACPSEPKRD